MSLLPIALCLTLSSSPEPQESFAGRPIVIAHRGASGYRPEHTLAAYELAIEMGADYIEPDLVVTKDGVLVARHENNIADTTDVADHPEFADRKTSKSYGRYTQEGWFTEDFTLEELKTLRAKERMPELRTESAQYDGRFDVPTLQEVIDLVREKETEAGRRIGIYPETKGSSYFRSIDLPIEERLVEVFRENGYEGSRAPVFIQSFEIANLVELNKMTDLPLIQLLGGGGSRPLDYELGDEIKTYNDLLTPDGLAAIATYADGIGPNTRLVVNSGDGNDYGEPTGLVERAQAAGLLVHVWTLRDEAQFLPANYQDDPTRAYLFFRDLNVDGIFTDFPDTAVNAFKSR